MVTEIATAERQSGSCGRDLGTRRGSVVVVNDTAYVNGGAAKVAIASSIGLAKNGWDVFFLAASGPVDPELSQCVGLAVTCTNQFEILSDPNRFRAMSQGLWNVPARQAMLSLLDGLDPADTVVHVHLWAKALSSSVISAAVDRNFCVVLTLHDYLYACPTGTLFNHRKGAVCELEPMSVRCLSTNCDSRNYAHKAWRTTRHSIEHSAGRFHRGLTSFVALGQHSLDVLARHLPPQADVRFIPNFVDMERPEPAPVERNDRFAFSGRLVPEKGARLAAAAAQLAGAQITFIGDGEQRDLVTRINPSSQILGWLSHAEGIAALRGSRALVFPSLWLEVQPLVILEAAANGIPVILPDCSAARDLVEDQVTGLWFRMGDTEDLAEKLRVMQDPVLAAKLGRASYEKYWSSPPTLARHLEKLEALYHDILDN
jgi:glycosyltransferase involved in cell wall biosynthesis